MSLLYPPLVVSADTSEGLADAADRLRTQVEGLSNDAVWELACTRLEQPHFPHRGAVLATDRAGFTAGLGALAHGTTTRNTLRGTADNAHAPVFVFPGQGPLRSDTASGLLHAVPTFRTLLEGYAQALYPQLGWDVITALSEDGGGDRLEDIQPMQFALTLALSDLWRHYGLRPAAIVGHSQGELAAAHAAGAVSRADGARLITLHSKALTRLQGAGAMLAVSASLDRVERLISNCGDQLTVSAVNGPADITVSGPPEQIVTLQEHLAENNIWAWRVPGVRVAGHSQQVDALEPQVLRDAAVIEPFTPHTALYSAVSGTRVGRDDLTPAYWFRNLRCPVRFDSVVRALLADGHRLFLEMSTQPALLTPIRATAESAGIPAAVVGTLDRRRADQNSLLTALTYAFVNGAQLDWTKVRADLCAPRPAAHVPGPGHPLLSREEALPHVDEWLFTGSLTPHQSWLHDHRIRHRTLVPGTVILDFVGYVGEKVGCHRIGELVLETPLELTGTREVTIQVVVSAADEDGNRPVAVYSQQVDATGATPSTQHASGRLCPALPDTVPPPGPWPPVDAQSVDVEELYTQLSHRGYHYGPAFRRVSALWRSPDTVYAEISLSEFAGRAHPAALDAAVHAALGLTTTADRVRLPFVWRDVSLYRPTGSRLRVRITPANDGDRLTISACDDHDTPVLQATSLELRPAPAAVHCVEWEYCDPQPEGAATGIRVVVAGSREVVDESCEGVEFLDLADFRQAMPTLVGSETLVPVLGCERGTSPLDSDIAAALTREVSRAIREWCTNPDRPAPVLVIATRGATTVRPDDRLFDLGAAGVWGVATAAQVEWPGRVVVIDIDQPASPAHLAAALASGAEQLALRNGTFYQLHQTASENCLALLSRAEWRLGTTRPGSVDGLALLEDPTVSRPLEPHEVRIRVRAASVNFRDVLVCLGRYPDPTAEMGCDGAGIVVEVGADCHDIDPGTPVMGIFGAFRATAIVDRNMIVPIPRGWSVSEAAAAPLVYATAFHGLIDVARLRAGDTVLIHAASTGVGTAAVHLARHRGAEVFATAHPRKWNVLRELGLDEAHIADSRSTAFEERFRRATAGVGIDVVIGGSVGQVAAASLRLVKPGGRYVDLSWKDPAAANDIRTRYPAIHYEPINILTLDPGRIQAILEQIRESAAAGHLPPPQLRAWDLRYAKQVFRFMSSGRHTGKLVLTIPLRLTSGAAVLLVGTQNRLLGEVAAHLTDKYGADVHTADPTSAESVLAAHPCSAMVALTPTAAEAVCLHHLTEHRDLDQFVLIARRAATSENRDTSNTVMETASLLGALVHCRRAHGQAGCVVRGVDVVDLPQVLDCLDEALGRAEPVLEAGPLAVRPVPSRGPRRAGGRGQPAWDRNSPQELRQQLHEVLSAEAIALLGHGLNATTTSFQQLGFDSLTAVAFAARLAEVTGLPLPSTLLFDHPTPAELVTWLCRQLGEESATDRVGEAADQEPARTDDPIAIVGMACRFAGEVDCAADLWRLLTSDTDALSPFPTDRGWDLARLRDPNLDLPGSSAAHRGGFLADAAGFDPALFDISQREAAAMDPQQRLLLELSWAVLEDAGIAPMSLRDSDTGVYLGCFAQEYGPRLPMATSDSAGHLLTGTTTSVASGRIAYTYGLHGPALTVDTACSSALVAIHLACEALRTGNCSLAIAGGATVMSGPGLFTEFTKQQGLARDGRCKPFAAAADGTNWGEGGGLLVLERLSDARRRGHHVLAVVAGSAINSDGASNGLTAPNGPSQERVIRQALTAAGLTPEAVDAVEAHGTGTPLGDPIEANALSAVYGAHHGPQRPLYLGSIKSTIGHTQAAAGVAGVIKMVLAIRNGLLPATRHIDAPTPHVDWSSGALHLLTTPRPWPDNHHPRTAAVSSFGISGTNAHLILQQSPPEPTPNVPDPAHTASLLLFPLSGHTSQALSDNATRLHDHVQAHGDIVPADLAYSLATTRTHQRFRATIAVTDTENPGATVRAALRSLTDGDSHRNVIYARGPVAEPGKLVFVCGGQGAQYPGMGAELYRLFPRYRGALDEVCAAFDPLLDSPHPLREIILSDPDTPAARLLDRTQFAQPALFAVQVALHALFVGFGVGPDILMGHSIGELTAAYLAGVWSLDDAVAMVAARGRFMQACPDQGRMLAVQVAEEDIAPLIRDRDGVSIAAVNGATEIVLSGDVEALVQVRELLEAQRRKSTFLQVSHGFHSADMDTAVRPFTEFAATVTYRRPRVPMQSCLTARPLRVDELADPGYWARQLRHTVGFHAAVGDLLRHGEHTFLELSPQAALVPVLSQTLADSPHAAYPTLRRNRSENVGIATALAHLHHRGHSPDWTRLNPGAQSIPLPTYAFQHRRYWLAPGNPTTPGLDHPLLDTVTELAADQGWIFTGHIGPSTQSWLADHVIDGTVLLSGSALVDIVLTAGRHAGCPHIAELVLHAPLVFREDTGFDIRVRVDGRDELGRMAITIHSCPVHPNDPTAAPWTLHAAANATPDVEPGSAGVRRPPESARPIEIAGLYSDLAERGYQYGPTFRAVTAGWIDESGSAFTGYADITLPDGLDPAGHQVHPVLLDAALHLVPMIIDADHDGVRIPFVFDDITLHAVRATRLHVVLTRTGSDTVTVRAVDPLCAPVFTIDTVALRPLPESAPAPTTSGLLELTWTPTATESLDATEYHTAGWAVLSSHAEGLPAIFDGLRSYSDISVLLAGNQLPTAVLWRPAAAETELPELVPAAADEALGLLQQWVTHPGTAGIPLLVCTSHAVVTDRHEGAPNLAHAAVWGLTRSAQSEHPNHSIILLDLALDTTPDLVAAVLGRLDPRENQVAVRQGTVYLPRLAPSHDLVPPDTQGGNWRLHVRDKGDLNSVAYLPTEPAALGPGEIRIAVRAAGVNFRDVVGALGLIENAGFGHEAAGVVVETGSEVRGFAVGDAVTGFVDDAFAPVAVADPCRMMRFPSDWSFAEAASVPVAFATAHVALVEIAELQPGQRVLVHAGTGGVGQAAIQLARHRGAEIFATASPAKQHLLRAMGIPPDHIASTRTLDFREAFLDTTDGSGMDVVLDCLAGDFVDASLDLLPRGGCFLEIGKTDIRDPEIVATIHPDVRYHALELTEFAPERISGTLAALRTLFEYQVLQPIPTTTYELSHARQALREMAAARHTGKLVLAPPPVLDPEGTVLITGGTGALGRLIAEHLITRHGVRHLLLVSRRGRAAPGADELIRRLTELGATVRIASCDITDPSALAKLFDTISSPHPLTAVVHAATVVDDAPVTALSEDRLGTVLAGKFAGAWQLHRLTEHLDLAAFVLFSSVAGILGHPGQANYAAANTALDALAHYRRQCGLAAVSIVWGPWDIGLAAGLSDNDRKRISAGGWATVTRESGTALFDRALTNGTSVVIAAPLRSDVLTGRTHLDTPPPPILSRLIATRPPTAAAPSANDGPQVAGLTVDQRHRYLLDAVCTAAAAALGHPDTSTIEPDDTFHHLGIDSLTALELRNTLTRSLRLELPPTLVFDHPTPNELARHLSTLLTPVTARHSTPVSTTPMAPVDDPIVVVGMSCRFPGGIDSPEGLWEVVSSGVDTIGEFPTDRGWNLQELFDPDPDTVGTTYTRHGGFLADAGGFDNELFEISPREALLMDPQQRVLLETCWAALETASCDPRALQGSRTGVFVGACAQQYQTVTTTTEGYALTGSATSVASGRIAYTLGLQGPAITIDTACSSSLVATHLACDSLRRGECDLAMAGGVTVMASPFVFTEFARQRGLAVDGRCKPFAAAADGTGWGEGAGIVVLERLSDAQRNHHPILAVVAGSAINQDGASNGLTAPNGPAQQRVIQQAMSNAGISGDQVDVVEAHGTGTALGDPIEAGALLATYGRSHSPESPLYLGSIKSNIGHTQAAAGVAGVIKMIQAIRRGVLPKTLHVDAPSPHVAWDGTVTLLTDTTGWPETDHPRTAAVSSFGISGTNAHLILQQPPNTLESHRNTVAAPAPRLLFPISAADPVASSSQIALLREHLATHPDIDPVDLAYSLATTRTHHSHRITIIGASNGADTRTTLTRALSAAEKGHPDPNLLRDAATRSTQLVFVLPGQGAQYPGMGRELHAHYPAYRVALDRACAALAPHLDLPADTTLRDVIHADPDTPEAALLERTDIVQPALFAVGVALGALLESVGVTPDVVIGHSQGEITAACLAGALSLEDAAKVIARRSGIIARQLAGTGTMASVSCDLATAEKLSSPWGNRISVAAVNGPANVTVAGAVEAIEALLQTCGDQDIRARAVRVDYASHCAGVETVHDKLAIELVGLVPRASRVAFHSTVDGQPHGTPLDTSTLTGEYWYHNLRRTVRFHETVTALLDSGAHTFLELSPHPVLTSVLEATLSDTQQTRSVSGGAGSVAVATLQRDRDDCTAFATTLARLHNHGHPLDWEALQPGQRIPLPTYPFHHRRYWQTTCAPAPGLPDGPVVADTADGVAPAMRHLKELAPADRRASVLDLVRRALGVVLGRGDGADIDLDMSLLEQGLTSIKGTELRGELTSVTGVGVPIGLVMSSVTTVRQLATHIDENLGTAGRSDQGDSSSGLVSLLRRALEGPLSDQGLEAIGAAALLRTQLEQSNEFRWTRLLPLSSGSGDTAIVCFPSLLPHSGPLEYSALAQRLDGRNLFALAQPGYLASENLPATREALAAGHIAQIEQKLPDRPLVLLGYSTGGWVGHCVAAELLARGHRRVGLVLVDTYGPTDLDRSFLTTLLRRAIEAHEESATDTSITAMASYLRMFSTFKPQPLAIPGMLIHAGRRHAAEEIVFPEHRRNRWTRRPGTVKISVPADHFTILSDEVEHTAAEIDRWLDKNGI